MRRRRLLLATLGAVTGLTGCMTADEVLRESPTTTSTPTPEPVDATVEDRVTDCEQHYIANELITSEDESITDRSGPVVVATERRSDGAYLELETQVGTARSREGEPDEHADYLVTAAYLVTDTDVFRTEGFDSDGDPRDGTVVDC